MYYKVFRGFGKIFKGLFRENLMKDNSTEQQETERDRPFQFSLGDLLRLTVAAALGCGVGRCCLGLEKGPLEIVDYACLGLFSLGVGSYFYAIMYGVTKFYSDD
jgi:hypothetical protein